MDTVNATAKIPEIDGVLCLPRLRIQSANAISGPLSHGFPAISAFLGLMWALERRLGDAPGLGLNAVGVVCHDFQELTYDQSRTQGFRLTRNPLLKDGSTAAIVEEGRIHLDISLIFGVSGEALFTLSDAGRAQLAQEVLQCVGTMRVAGGSVLPQDHDISPSLELLADNPADRAAQFRRWRYRWLPGFALVSRADLPHKHLAELQQNDPQATSWDAWLDLCRLNTRWGKNDKGDEGWITDPRSGWLVPLPVGYGALSDLHSPSEVRNARDTCTPLRFVESLYSVGQWISPHRLHSLRQLLWYNACAPDSGSYLVCNDYPLSL